MNKYRAYIPLENPVILGVLDSDVLHNVGDKYDDGFFSIIDRDICDERARKFVDDERYRLGDPELLRTLEPIGKVVAEYVLRQHGVEPFQIEYMAHKDPVEPGETQLGDGWHVDYSESSLRDKRRLREEILVVSSVADFTTEVLVREDDFEESWRQQRKNARFIRRMGSHFVRSDEMEPAINSGRFHIYQPQAYEMMLITKRFHRSPSNLTDQPIERSIVRATARYDTYDQDFRGNRIN